MHSSGMRTARFSGFRGEGIFVPFTETPWTETSPEGTWDQVQRPDRQKPAEGTCDQAQRPPPCVQTDTCENITLHQTSFADGNYKTQSVKRFKMNHREKRSIPTSRKIKYTCFHKNLDLRSFTQFTLINLQ